MAYRERSESPERLLSRLAHSLGWDVPQEVSAHDLMPLWRAMSKPLINVSSTQT